jgi:hypothetical protein
VRKFLFLFVGIFLVSLAVLGQEDATYDEDSVVESETDTSLVYNEVEYKALPDSSRVQHKAFSESKYDELKKDSDLDYTQAPTVGQSLWKRFLGWLGQLINTIFENAVTTNWGRVLLYAVTLGLIIVIIMMILKVNAFRVLYSGEGQAQKYQVFDENIHEMDFEKLIKDTLDQKDYRRGVRLVFLYALKLLSDKDLIHFQSGKTNHDYVAELNEKDLKTGFNELSFYFEYAWYGNFNINLETFKKVDDTFKNWRSKMH